MNANRVRHLPDSRNVNGGQQVVRSYTSRDLWLMILKAASPTYRLAKVSQPRDCNSREQQ